MNSVKDENYKQTSNQKYYLNDHKERILIYFVLILYFIEFKKDYSNR